LICLINNWKQAYLIHDRHLIEKSNIKCKTSNIKRHFKRQILLQTSNITSNVELKCHIKRQTSLQMSNGTSNIKLWMSSVIKSYFKGYFKCYIKHHLKLIKYHLKLIRFRTSNIKSLKVTSNWSNITSNVRCYFKRQTLPQSFIRRRL
jgi:hypothetical protein